MLYSRSLLINFLYFNSKYLPFSSSNHICSILTHIFCLCVCEEWGWVGVCILFDSIFLWDPKFQPGKKKKRFPESIKELIRFRGRKSKKTKQKQKHWGSIYLCIIWKWKLLSCVRLFTTPWTIAYQAPLSMEFSRPKYWNRWPFPSPGDLANPGIEPKSPTLQADSLSSEPPEKPIQKPKTYCMLTSLFIVSPEVPDYSFSWYHAPGIPVLEHF